MKTNKPNEHNDLSDAGETESGGDLNMWYVSVDALTY